MSTATMNVWITAFGDPCHIEQTDRWFVHVLDCEGRIIEWCGKKYTNIPAKCGHAEFQLPPGCYAVCATHSESSSSAFLGNRLTHVQVVRVNCGDHACVTLFSPTSWNCGTWFIQAVEAAARAGGVDRERAAAAVQAVRGVLADVRPDPFTEAQLQIVAQTNQDYVFEADAD